MTALEHERMLEWLKPALEASGATDVGVYSAAPNRAAIMRAFVPRVGWVTLEVAVDGGHRE